jgi:hypothetical protein
VEGNKGITKYSFNRMWDNIVSSMIITLCLDNLKTPGSHPAFFLLMMLI